MAHTEVKTRQTTAAQGVDAAPGATSAPAPVRGFLSRYLLWIALVVLVAGAEIGSKGSFLAPQNLLNVLSQNAVAGVLAAGQTLIILTSGIDLSLGSITALSSMTVLLLQGQGLVVAIPAGIGVALACGLVNGLLVSLGRIPPFIATLGMMQFGLGLAYVIGGGFPVYQNDAAPLLFGVANLGPIPIIVIIWVLVTVVTWVVARRMRYGSFVYATGGNERAARTSGIPIARVKIFVYAFAGLCAGVAGLLWIDRLGYSQPNIGDSLTLTSIAPVVVGGTSLFGGRGGVWNTFAGVLVVGVLVNVMVLVGVNADIQQAVQGAIVIAVVILFVRRQGLARSA